MSLRLALGAGLVTLAAARTSRATDYVCEAPFHAGHLVAPRDGAREVPTDTQIWIGLDSLEQVEVDGSEIILVGPDGEVALGPETALEIPLSRVLVRRPAAPLVPDREYGVWLCRAERCDVFVTGFRTGPGPHAGAPPRPHLIGEDPDQGSGRGYFSMQVDFEGILVVDRADGDFDGPGLAGAAVTFSADPAAPVELVAGECGNWSGDSTRAALRFGAYDPSGAFSGWSEPSTVEMSGCALAPSPGLPALLLLLVGRRRRPREATP